MAGKGRFFVECEPSLIAELRGVLLVRHAQPLMEPGVCYGAWDIAADPAATDTCAEALARHVAPGARLVSSPLRRCTQLTRKLRMLRPDLISSTDVRLVEMNFGCWEGWRWSDIPKAAIDAWTQRFGEHRFGGRENVSEFMHRVGAAWDDAQQCGGPVVWVTHAGVIRAATLLSRGIRQVEHADHWPRDTPVFGQSVWLPCGNRVSVADQPRANKD